MNETADQRKPDLADRGTFSFWTTEKIRFQDVDRLDHVNNVAITAYAECGRVEFLYGKAMPGAEEQGPTWVVARLLVDFVAQARFPGRVEIGTHVLRLGRSSATLGQGLFVQGRCIATAETVVVLIDPGSGRGVAMPGSVRAALEAYLD